MEFVITVAALVMVPAVLLSELVHARTRHCNQLAPGAHANQSGRRRDTAPVAPSLERLVGDLRRLELEYRRIERSDLPARAARLRAVGLAYDDTLRACCRALQLPAPDPSPLSAVTRLETEVALSQRGLSW